MTFKPGTQNPIRFAAAVLTVVGTTVGAGILGLPYAIAQAGFLPGSLLLLFVGMATMVLNLMYAELILRTRSDHEIPGYGGVYVGKGAQMIALLAGLLGSYGALLAYAIGESRVLSGLFGGPPLLWGLLFLILGGYVIFRGLDMVRRFEFVLSISLLCILFLIGVAVHPHINTAHLARVDVNNLATPYGVLMFAFAGTASVPLVRKQMVGREKAIPKVFLVANSLILIAYFLFVWVVLGATGAETTDIATLGLTRVVGPWMGLMGNVLAAVTLFSGFIAMGLSLRRVFECDYGLTRPQAWLSTMIIPTALFLVGMREFVVVLGVSGGIVLGVQGVLIVLAFWRSQKVSFLHKVFPFEMGRKPEFELGSQLVVGVVLFGMYVIGAVLTILNFV